MSVTDELQERREAQAAGDEGDGVGVVESDLAEDTPPETGGESSPESAPVAEQKPPKPMQIPIPGTTEGISDVAGGTLPTSSEARILGGSIPIEGEFEGEEFVTLTITAKVSEVDFVYTYDDWGKTKNVKRRHKFQMMSVRRAQASAD